DDVRAAELATNRLISVGCRKIAFVGVPVNAYEPRLVGYRNSLERAGIPVTPELEVDLAATHHVAQTQGTAQGISDQWGAKLVNLVREKGVDGMVCINDVIALRVIRTLHEAGIQVPRDVAVVGFDNIQAATTSMPSLSTIDYN